ncbi:MAG: DNA ligase [Desulfuromonas sp.]|nr:DNA ligase [Desulfuromonas sp.]
MFFPNLQCSTSNLIATRWSILLFALLLQAQLAMAFDPMLPRVYSTNVDVSGWLMSEKLDGVRAYWDGQQLYSKNGHLLQPPKQFTVDLPNFPLEGELWGGHGTFQQVASTIQRQQPHAGWLKLKFAIFDAPTIPGGFAQRIVQAQQWFSNHPSAYAFVIKQTIVRDADHLQQQLRAIEHAGGEGLIVRQAEALYIHGRSHTILKVKSYQDAEATVIAHLPGHGRNRARMGALVVELNNGIQFRLGSGFSDAEREHPPAIGENITFKYYGYYPSGIPKFPSFMRCKADAEL